MTTTWAITTMEGLGNRLHLVRDDALDQWAACGRRLRFHHAGRRSDRLRRLRCLTAPDA